ncbi:MAG: hypothetical protein A2W93_06655 [Bacteroidetes bacterium GWF2_43_63]|nr:MAG: hypothetical protein A2W94_07880 [Bacteroidetes bacterium GWE2_42_42]OFY53300.1 MAG: hypothetical protein A2W93_06655 [Bacteroidetes bacterium GWF2_43_63]
MNKVIRFKLNKLLPNTVFAILIAAGFILSGCTADEQLGLDIQPPGDELNAVKSDTFLITAFTRLADSVKTDETAVSLAGYYTDPVFGPTKASFCTQLRLSGTDVDFGNNVVIDSVILHLEYYNIYGNNKQNNRMTFNVHELKNSISPDSSYYAFSPIESGQRLGSISFLPNNNDSIYIDGERLGPQLRIPLDKNLGKRVVEASTMGALSSNATFEEFFHGISVVPTLENQNGSIISFDVLSANSGLSVYYHNDTDTLSYKFNITMACARYNNFNHYSFAGGNPDLLAQVNGDTALGQQKLYLQPLGGTEVVLKFPDIESLNSAFSVIINRAELFIPADQSDVTNENYPRPVKLALVALDEDGDYAFLSDNTIDAETYGGFYDENLGCYRFVITRHMQDLITGGKTSYGYVLMVSGTSIYGNRVILNGPDNANPMKLELTYTLIQ